MSGFPYGCRPSFFQAAATSGCFFFCKQLLHAVIVLPVGVIKPLSVLLLYLLYINRIHRVVFFFLTGAFDGVFLLKVHFGIEKSATGHFSETRRARFQISKEATLITPIPEKDQREGEASRPGGSRHRRKNRCFLFSQAARVCVNGSSTGSAGSQAAKSCRNQWKVSVTAWGTCASLRLTRRVT